MAIKCPQTIRRVAQRFASLRVIRCLMGRRPRPSLPNVVDLALDLVGGLARIYKNNTLLTTVTLNAADQSFFNAKGGKLGLWTIAAPNAFFDDFGGGAPDGVSAAETAGEEPSTDASAQTNTIFLPLVSR